MDNVIISSYYDKYIKDSLLVLCNPNSRNNSLRGRKSNTEETIFGVLKLDREKEKKSSTAITLLQKRKINGDNGVLLSFQQEMS